MTDLILTSSFNGNKLLRVGEATLQNNIISIDAEKDTTVNLLRGVNKVVLLQANDQKQTTKGRVVLGDVYTLENKEDKLIIKVENLEVQYETNLYINTNPTIDATSNKRKTTLTVGVLLLILLIISVVFGIKQKNQKILDVKTKLEEKIAEERSKYEIKAEIKELLDLTLQINGFSGNKLASTGETMFVFDEKEKNIIQVDVNGKNAKIIAKKDDLKDTKQIAVYEDKLFLDKLDEVYEVDENSLFYVYSGNIYVVSKTENQIFRYTGNAGTLRDKTFAEKSEWLAPGIEADFSKVIDMTIDGSIWLLSSTGKVTKFTNGNPVLISLNGIIEKLENPTAIYTNEELKYVYILDKNKGRVVVLEKNGNFKIQYISDQIKNTTDLVVSEKEGKIILLSGSKLMYFEPKQ